MFELNYNINRRLHRRGHKWSLMLSFLLFFNISVSASPVPETIHHQLHVSLQPAENSISVSDIIQLPAGTARTEFTLRNGLTVEAVGAELIPLDGSGAGRFRHYRINRLQADGKVQLDYTGKISSEETKGPFDMPESILSPESVYLDSGSAWLPSFNDYPLYTYNLNVDAPENWQIVSQGKRTDVPGGYSFDMPHPQDDIYLVGGPYQRYSKVYDGVEIVVYLFKADAALADSYLQTSAHYISLYSDWIGRYPYAKFAVVENRWQTGYGMPSFTLLGSRVIRLPFILDTSLPHEIVHNWWGNGVYIDFSHGNWSEGLTAYMSDHFSSEQQGKGREYRRKALERYANFAAEHSDFALAGFRSRHDEASQAIGYSKSLMLFHMLRQQSGDDAFDKNIRAFWRRYQFSYANFVDLIGQLYTGDTSGNDNSVGHFIEQWLNSTGAPEISLDKVSVDKKEDGYLVSVWIKQLQKGSAYTLTVPLDISLHGETKPVRKNIPLKEKNNHVSFKFAEQPLALTLDPDYDVFRLLSSDERPATLGRLFGAKKQLLVMPAKATAEQVSAWQQLAADWSNRYNNVELVFDNKIKKIPDGSVLWLLGWDNGLLKDRLKDLASTSGTHSQALRGDTASMDGELLPADDYAVLLLDADNRHTPLGFIGARDPGTIAAMARKLPHYSSYGALAFKLPGVNNTIKKHLPVTDSPMQWKSD